MKKFGKFLATTFSLAAILGGAYYFYQNVIKKSDNDEDEFDDFEDFEDFDDYDDFDFDDTDKNASSKKSKSNRGYTTLDMDAMKADNEEEADNEANQDTDQDHVKVFDLNEDDME